MGQARHSFEVEANFWHVVNLFDLSLIENPKLTYADGYFRIIGTCVRNANYYKWVEHNKREIEKL